MLTLFLLFVFHRIIFLVVFFALLFLLFYFSFYFHDIRFDQKLEIRISYVRFRFNSKRLYLHFNVKECSKVDFHGAETKISVKCLTRYFYPCVLFCCLFFASSLLSVDSSYGVMAEMLDCYREVSEFELRPLYDIPFRTNTLRKGNEFAHLKLWVK